MTSPKAPPVPRTPQPEPPPREPGTPRELPDFLKVGDAELGTGRPRYPGMQIGKGFPEARPRPMTGVDPASARERAVWEWEWARLRPR